MVLTLLKPKRSLFGLVLAFSCIFVSCLNLLSDSEFEKASEKPSRETDEIIYLTGHIESSVQNESSQLKNIDLTTSAKNEDSSRIAMPSISVDGTNYVYFVTAETVDATPALSADGTVDSSLSYTIGLKSGYKWKVTAGIKRKSDNHQILTDSEVVTISSQNPVLEKNMKLKPAAGTGSVSLSLNIDSAVAVNKVFVTLGNYPPVEMVDKSTIALSSVDSGSYNATIEFYDSNDIVIYSLVQAINVFPSMSTDTWFLGTGSGLSTDSSGKLNITTSLIQAWERSVFYVSEDKIAEGEAFSSPDDSYDGSPYKPLATISKAIQNIKSKGNSGTDYTIYVKGKIEDNVNIDATNIKSLTIKNIRGATATVDGKKTGTASVITVDTTISVTINGLKIQKGSAPNGGGIYFKKGSHNVINCIIDDNSATNGGGIYIDSSAQIILSGTSITNNEAVKGGGIYNTSANTVIYDGLIDSNTAINIGGGISTNVAMSISGGTISNNIAVASGGGLMCEDSDSAYSVNFTAGTITNNEASGTEQRDWDGVGGGVCIAKNAKLIMSGTAEILSNKSFRGGGGVRINDAATSSFEMSGGLISQNIASGYGGGVDVNGSFVMTGGEISSNTATKGGAISHAGTESSVSVSLGAEINVPVGADNKNDIYVGSGNTITLGNSIAASAPDFNLTLSEYTVGRVILSGDDYLIKSNNSKFKFTNTEYSVSKNGKVRLTNSITTLNIEDSAEASDDIPLPSINSSSKFKTIKRALQFITFQEDDEADYILHINGTITGTHIIPASDTTDTDIITIDNTTAKSILIDGENDAKLDGNESTSAAVLDVSTSVPVTITNLKITNGKSHGLQIGKLGVNQYNSIVKLGSGAKICGNSTDANGGGVCIEPNGELYMYGDAIIGEAELLGGSYSNSASNSGGGIYCNGGTVYIGYTDNTHSDNSFSGGVYYNYAGFGAGIFLAGSATLNINKGHVVYNFASLQGGGIYLKDSASANIESGTISNNNSVNEGGGIRCAGTGEVVIKNSIIQNNASSGGSASYGGGVYVGDGSTITLSGSSYIPYGIGNDVYLNGNGYIIVGSTLTSSGIVASITPASYDVDKKLLDISEDVDLDNVIPKFNVTPKDGVAYTIYYKDYCGLLTLDITSDNVIEVISALTENGTVKVMGELTSQKLTEINTAINDLPDNIFVYLDLGNVTGLTRLEANLFKDNLHLSSITIPNTVTDIEANAFAGCTYLCSVDLPENLTLINMDVFADCTYLGSITIPASVIRIGMEAFQNCTGLESVIIKCSDPPKLTQINTHAFQNCSNLVSITWEGTKETWNAISLEKSSGNEWNSGCPASLKIECSNGEVDPL